VRCCGWEDARGFSVSIINKYSVFVRFWGRVGRERAEGRTLGGIRHLLQNFFAESRELFTAGRDVYIGFEGKLFAEGRKRNGYYFTFSNLCSISNSADIT